MRIESLQVVRRRGVAFVVVTGDDATQLEVDPELAVVFQLRTGMELDAATTETLRARQEALSAKRKLVGHLSLRLKSRAESADYLRRAGFGEPAVEAALAGAQELGLLDDARFAQALRVTRERTARRGPRAIRHELVARGVAPEVADAAVAPGAETETQLANARAAAAKKAAGLGREEPAKAVRKLMDFLLRRGYDGDIAARVVRELLSEPE